MKKSLLAVAVLSLFAGAAAAQSSVTIYGSVDQGVAKGNGGTATNPNNAGGPTAALNGWQVGSGNWNRLGFRGNEDLGGGLSAQFALEHRFYADSGTQVGTPFWGGHSYVQLSSAQAGSVYLGRNYTPLFLLAVRLDPFGWAGIAQTGSNQYANYCQPDSAAAANVNTCAGTNVRASNSVGYRTPSLGGFIGTVAVSASEGTQNGRNVSATGTYGAGPLFVGIGVEKNDKGTFDGTGLWNIGASYNFGVTNLMLYGAHSSYGANGDLHANVYQIADITPIGPGRLKVSFSYVKPSSDNLTKAALASSVYAANNKRKKLGIGYDYFLSKRTNLYAEAGLAREDNKTNSSVYQVGIRHDF